ncbi:MAG: RIP metalloprotease RseP [Spirochaetales bacterium]|nr:RIP metalloprotease RseP [Spirochaetales bacterium]
MILWTIFLGLFGLGIIIIVHELGHLIAARLSGIEVEAFAVGWGKSLKSFYYKNTEYRINIFPVGGYCKMKGEDDFRKAIENKYSVFPKKPGSIFSVSPVKRFVTYAAGPFFNFIFAIILFSLVWAIGYETQTYSNKIVLSSEYSNILGNGLKPADTAGLQSGDIIISINNQEINNFSDIQNALLTTGGKTIPISFIRNDTTYTSKITPEIDLSSGMGILGIYAWIEPIVTAVPEASPEQVAGFKIGDKIISINNKTVTHVLDMYEELLNNTGIATIQVQREGVVETLQFVPEYTEEGQILLQLGFPSSSESHKATDFFDAIKKGTIEAVSTFSLAIQSIRMIFKGLNLKEAMAGPIKITYLVGEATAAGFRQSFLTGIRTLLQLLGFVSVALSFANLLPIPALDGGQMVLSAAEAITRRQISPGKYYILQIIGFTILFTILILTVFNDIRFFLKF